MDGLDISWVCLSLIGWEWVRYEAVLLIEQGIGAHLDDVDCVVQFRCEFIFGMEDGRGRVG